MFSRFQVDQLEKAFHEKVGGMFVAFTFFSEISSSERQEFDGQSTVFVEETGVFQMSSQKMNEIIFIHDVKQ